MSPKQTRAGRVFECNQDNGECLNDKGYPSSFWPKRNNGGARGGSNGFKSRSGAEGGYDAETTARITRSHAQEMALRYAALKGMNEIKPDELRALITWFANDVLKASKPKPAPKPQPEPEPEPEPEFEDDEIPV